MQSDAPSRAEADNIASIVRLEEEEERRASPAENLAEAIGSFAGTIHFALTQLALVVAWISINQGLVNGIRPFDPYPFPLLSVVLSLEAVLLASFVLIRQNRMSLRADRRAQLELQINLLAEQEATKTLQMLQRISQHLGIEAPSDPETQELSRDTAVEHLERGLRAGLKDGDTAAPRGSNPAD